MELKFALLLGKKKKKKSKFEVGHIVTNPTPESLISKFVMNFLKKNFCTKLQNKVEIGELGLYAIN
mgnify:CR=1 FL=1